MMYSAINEMPNPSRGVKTDLVALGRCENSIGVITLNV